MATVLDRRRAVLAAWSRDRLGLMTAACWQRPWPMPFLLFCPPRGISPLTAPHLSDPRVCLPLRGVALLVNGCSLQMGWVPACLGGGLITI